MRSLLMEEKMIPLNYDVRFNVAYNHDNYYSQYVYEIYCQVDEKLHVQKGFNYEYVVKSLFLPAYVKDSNTAYLGKLCHPLEPKNEYPFVILDCDLIRIVGFACGKQGISKEMYEKDLVRVAEI